MSFQDSAKAFVAPGFFSAWTDLWATALFLDQVLGRFIILSPTVAGTAVPTLCPTHIAGAVVSYECRIHC